MGEPSFACEGDKIKVLAEVNGEYSDEESCDEGISDIDQSTENVNENNDNASHQVQASNASPFLIQLAPLCESEELKRDATFLDELGLLLQKEETIVKLAPQVACITKQYIIARRNLKKRIRLQQEKNLNSSIEQDEMNEDQLEDAAPTNLFDNLLVNSPR